jgi:hypothetical protein
MGFGYGTDAIAAFGRKKMLHLQQVPNRHAAMAGPGAGGTHIAR